jgi:hypothetical protein
MEVSRQNLAALSWGGNKTPLPRYPVGWLPDPVWTFWRREKPPDAAGNLTLCSLTHSADTKNRVLHRLQQTKEIRHESVSESATRQLKLRTRNTGPRSCDFT